MHFKMAANDVGKHVKVNISICKDTEHAVSRKRKPRSAGEVCITCPTSQVYLNNTEKKVLIQPICEHTPYESQQLSVERQVILRYTDHKSYICITHIEYNQRKQSMVVSTFVDDSEHNYEPFSPLNTKPSSHKCIKHGSTHKPFFHLSKQSVDVLRQRAREIRDDYDSSCMDTNDINVFEKQIPYQNDGYLQLYNVKLPEPSTSTKQMYGIIEKFKNFMASKKTPKLLDNESNSHKNAFLSSQFYVESNTYRKITKVQSEIQIPERTLITHDAPVRSPFNTDCFYDNIEFRKLPSISNVNRLINSEKNLTTDVWINDLSNTTLRSKKNSCKSLTKRVQKSLCSSTVEGKKISTLFSRRSTFYIDDPTHGWSRKLDSGVWEKTSTGDLMLTASQKSQNVAILTSLSEKEESAISLRKCSAISLRQYEPYPHKKTTTTMHFNSIETKSSKNNRENETQNLQLLSSSKCIDSQNVSIMPNGSSHYAQEGLYGTSRISLPSCSERSGLSKMNATGLDDRMPYSLFLNEPLYQIYSAAKLKSISNDIDDNDESLNGYEDIGQQNKAEHEKKNMNQNQINGRPTALQLVEPKVGPSRTLWSEIPEVIHSCFLSALTPQELCLQEAKFEIITSEASYLKSLNLLRSHFMNQPIFHNIHVLNERDRIMLFSHILPVYECSERLLSEMESCWQENMMLVGLSKRIYAVAESNFHVYIAFCENQGHMDRTLRRLKKFKSVFTQNLDLLEANSVCCGLNLHSFLMLPMQRITRLPLLIDAVFSKVNRNDNEYKSWKLALAIMNKIVAECNEAANRCEQAYEIERISRQLEFPSTLRTIAISTVGLTAYSSKPRFLVKKGELTQLIWRGADVKLTFGKKFYKATIYAFLFSDLLVLTKRKSDEQYVVFDYCPRNMLSISSGISLSQMSTKDIKRTHKNLILFTLLENCEHKTVELVFSCASVSEQERWLQAMRPSEVGTLGEKLYEEWDCPQVIAKHCYESSEPDAINLEVGDVVNVTRKLPDGWYRGERIRDGAIGWFPCSYTEEVNSAHVRARNLKQRYRLLTFTASYIESRNCK